MNERGRYLIERYSFTYLSSARDLQRLQFNAPSKEPPVIIANPDFNKGDSGKESMRTGFAFVPLPGSEEEAQRIAQLFTGARILQGAEATEDSLKRVRGPSILHIGTHGFFPTSEPNLNATKINGEEVFKPSILLLRLEANRTKSGAEYVQWLSRSGLALAGANIRGRAEGDDGILTAFEMSGLDLTGTKLAVLSACETGLGNVESGNGVDGMRRALLVAGSQSQVISLWKVNDAVTRDIMIDFYTRLRAGAGRGEALRQAKLATLRGKGHPYYWASFIQSGDWRSLDATSNSRPPTLPSKRATTRTRRRAK